MPGSKSTLLGDVASILRLHIVVIAMCACVVFGWLLTGSVPVELALLGGADWLLINLLNRITDLKEDLANDIRGSERVARSKRHFTIAFVVLFTLSFAWSLTQVPWLTPWRVSVQLIGLGYSIPMVPTLRGLRRFKDLYFFKNFMSSMLFVQTVFIYPLAALNFELSGALGWPAAICLVVFFVLFELTYEILYDMRDLKGDTLAKVPTYPVVHGMVTSKKIVNALLVGSSLSLLTGIALGWLGLREGLMLAAPALQYAFYRPRVRRGLASADCIGLTHLGSALLLFYLAGNAIWLRLGGPANLYL